jgi:hypothetical protein
LFTTVPSMEMSPELIASSPAIHPQRRGLAAPDGPTNTTRLLFADLQGSHL